MIQERTVCCSGRLGERMSSCSCVWAVSRCVVAMQKDEAVRSREMVMVMVMSRKRWMLDRSIESGN